MATIGTALNLLDWAKRTDPDGSVPMIVELLAQDNPIVEDAIALESNSATYHRTTVRTGLPAVYWRRLNKGIPSSKSTTVQVDEPFGLLESESAVDKKLADLNGNRAEFRFSEDQGFLESMNQEIASKVVYADNSLNSEQFTGLAPRFGDLSAQNGQNILDAGGTGSDNTSMWFITWGERTCHAIFPKGSKAGLDSIDLDLQRVSDSNGDTYLALVTRYMWELGIAVRDWRYVVRIANIDVSDLTADASTGANLFDLMVRAHHKLFRVGGNTRIYCNRDISTYLDLQAANKVNVNLTYNAPMGDGMVLGFKQMPIRTTDSILSTESQVT